METFAVWLGTSGLTTLPATNRARICLLQLPENQDMILRTTRRRKPVFDSAAPMTNTGMTIQMTPPLHAEYAVASGTHLVMTSIICMNRHVTKSGSVPPIQKNTAMTKMPRECHPSGGRPSGASVRKNTTMAMMPRMPKTACFLLK